MSYCSHFNYCAEGSLSPRGPLYRVSTDCKQSQCTYLVISYGSISQVYINNKLEMIRCLDLVAIPYNHCAELSDFLIQVTCIKIIQHVKIIRIKLRGPWKQMETLSDMHPSNNYIINGFVFFQKHDTSPLNFIHKVTGP